MTSATSDPQPGAYFIERDPDMDSSSYTLRVQSKLQLAIFYGWVPRRVQRSAKRSTEAASIVECELTIPSGQTKPREIPRWMKPEQEE